MLRDVLLAKASLEQLGRLVFQALLPKAEHDLDDEKDETDED
jgi:hypothetical protein